MSSTTPPIQTPIPPEAESIRSITRVAGILALIFGIILMIIGAVMLLFIVGVIPLIFGIIDIIIYRNCSEIIRLIEMGDYRRAREKTLIWMIIGFIVGGIIIGILLLVAYLKYDELVRYTQQPRQLTAQV
jgi:sensor histidine kinase YesM